MNNKRNASFVHHRKDRDLYYAIVDHGSVGGKRSRVWSRGFKRRDDAKAELKRMLQDDAVGRKTRTTVYGVVSEYIGSHRTRLAATTYERYCGLLKNNLVEIHGEQVESLTLGRLERHYTLLRTRDSRRKKPLSETTISHVHDLLRSALAHAFAVEAISKNVLERTGTYQRPTRKKTEARALTPEAAQAILKEMHRTRLARAVRLALFTGMRRGEIAGLRWESVQWDGKEKRGGLITVRESRYQVAAGTGQKATKTERVRAMRLTGMAAKELRDQHLWQLEAKIKSHGLWQDTGFVFTDEVGRPLKPMAFTDAFRHVAEKAGFTGGLFTLKNMRHTAATWMLAQGMDIKRVQTTLGHSSATTTLNIYGHVVERETSPLTAVEDVLAGADVNPLVNPFDAKRRVSGNDGE